MLFPVFITSHILGIKLVMSTAFSSSSFVGEKLVGGGESDSAQSEEEGTSGTTAQTEPDSASLEGENTSGNTLFLP